MKKVFVVIGSIFGGIIVLGGVFAIMMHKLGQDLACMTFNMDEEDFKM